jgi:[ribosomal protein S5]-alanine N-acetyltransferase
MLTGADALPTITTERLRLRALSPGDVPALAVIFGDAEVCRFWSHAALTDAGAVQALYDHIVKCFAARSLFQWGIAERDSDAVVGTCTLAALSPEHRRAELGFALARASWGRGLIAEALPAVVGFAFETLDLHRLEADVDPRNYRSIRAIERLGFNREGHLRERYHVNGELQDAMLYGLLRRDWVSLKRTRDSGAGHHQT